MTAFAPATAIVTAASAPPPVAAEMTADPPSIKMGSEVNCSARIVHCERSFARATALGPWILSRSSASAQVRPSTESLLSEMMTSSLSRVWGRSGEPLAFRRLRGAGAVRARCAARLTPAASTRARGAGVSAPPRAAMIRTVIAAWAMPGANRTTNRPVCAFGVAEMTPAIRAIAAAARVHAAASPRHAAHARRKRPGTRSCKTSIGERIVIEQRSWRSLARKHRHVTVSRRSYLRNAQAPFG